MPYLKFGGGLLFALVLLMLPAQALDAAKNAMRVWAGAFAPALFPFFVITDALSTKEAQGLYRRAFGRLFEAAFGLPGQAAGAVMIGMMAGSPAGAIAVGKVKGLTRAQARRAALLASGVSPAFLITAVGAGMLGDPGLGAVLLRAQLGALILSGVLLRRAWAGENQAMDFADASAAPTGVRGAAVNMLTVCGYMIVFSVGARMISLLLPGGAWPAMLLGLTEVSCGCAALSASGLAREAALVLLAAVCCFGSASIIAQCLGRLRGLGAAQFVLGKLLHAILGAGLCALQLRLPLPVTERLLPPVVLAAACVLALAAALSIRERLCYNGVKQKPEG